MERLILEYYLDGVYYTAPIIYNSKTEALTDFKELFIVQQLKNIDVYSTFCFGNNEFAYIEFYNCSGGRNEFRMPSVFTIDEYFRYVEDLKIGV